MVVAMFVRGTSLPTPRRAGRAAAAAGARGRRGSGSTALLATTVAVVALIVLPYDFRQALITSLLATIMCLSLVVITGYVGQISVVQLALAGVSGFIVSHLAADHGVGFPVGDADRRRRRDGLRPRRRGLGAARARRQPRRRHARGRGGDRAVRLPQHDLGRRQLELAGAGADDLRPRPRPVRRRSAALDGKVPSPVFGFFVLGVALALGAARRQPAPLEPRAADARGALERARRGRGRASTSATSSSPRSGSAPSSPASAARSTATTSARSPSRRFSALTALSLIAFAYVGGITMVSGARRSPASSRSRRCSRTRSRSGSASRATGRCCSAASR